MNASKIVITHNTHISTHLSIKPHTPRDIANGIFFSRRPWRSMCSRTTHSCASGGWSSRSRSLKPTADSMRLLTASLQRLNCPSRCAGTMSHGAREHDMASTATALLRTEERTTSHTFTTQQKAAHGTAGRQQQTTAVPARTMLERPTTRSCSSAASCSRARPPSACPCTLAGRTSLTSSSRTSSRTGYNVRRGHKQQYSSKKVPPTPRLMRCLPWTLQHVYTRVLTSDRQILHVLSLA